MISQCAARKTYNSSRMRAALFGGVALLFALIAAPAAQGCSASDPNIVTIPIKSPPVSLYINMFGTAGNSYFTINSATSDQPWANASSILQHFGVVWTIDPSGLPLGLSCANLTTPLTEIVPTACDVNGIIFGRGCPYGSNPNGLPRHLHLPRHRDANYRDRVHYLYLVLRCYRAADKRQCNV